MGLSSGFTTLGSITSSAKSIYSSAKSMYDTATKKTEILDKRIRLRPKQGAESYVYGTDSNGILSVLKDTNGMVWAVTPSIAESHVVKYSAYEPTHSVSKYNTFDSVDNVVLQVTGDFYANNSTEARYLLACVHFLRSVTKMDFGKRSKDPGTPPPVLLFSGYGAYMFNDIPVIVKNVNFTLQPDVDYVQVPMTVSTSTAEEFNFLKPSTFKLSNIMNYYQKSTKDPDRIWVPTKLTISITLEQQPTADWVANEFNLNDFKNGTLLKGGGFI